MELSGWLERTRTPRSAFARAVGVSPGRITQICEGDLPSLELAERIARETAGAVTPNDFVGLVPSQQWINNLMTDTQARVTAAVEAFGRGEIVVVTDDDDRENEGDLVMAAVHATPEKMAFIIRNTCGIVCAPLPAATAHRLRLAPMVAENDAPHGTAFTVTIDYKHGTTTGISAEDRVATVRGLANNNAGATDFARPGHIFPLIAKDGGVLMRSGHTEAAIDLCKLANLEPVGVICELVNDDGTVMRGPQIKVFAEKHKLKHISVAELIAYRQAREKLVERVGEFTVETTIGTLKGYAYVTPFDRVPHMALRARQDRRRRRHADAAASRQHHHRCVRRCEGGQRRARALQAGRPRRDRGAARRHRRRADAEAAAGRRERGRGRAHAAMARGWARRADLEGSRRAVDPAAVEQQAQLCGLGRVRDRDYRDGGIGGVTPNALHSLTAPESDDT